MILQVDRPCRGTWLGRRRRGASLTWQLHIIMDPDTVVKNRHAGMIF